MKKCFFILTILTILHFTSSSSEKKYYSPQEVIDEERKIDFGEEYYKTVIENIKIYLNSYIYKDIAMDPPLSGLEKVNLDLKLSRISTNNTNFYDFYRKVLETVCSVKDGHLEIKFFNTEKYQSNIWKYKVVNPVVFYTEVINGIPEMKAKPNPEMEKYSDYKYWDEIKQQIEENRNYTINTINHVSPFFFIQNYGQDFGFLKSKNSHYSYTLSHFGSQYLSELPFEKEACYEMEIEFNSQSKNKTLNLKPIFVDTTQEDFIESEENREKYSKILQNKESNFYVYSRTLTPEKVEEDFKELIGHKNVRKLTSVVDWDHTSGQEIKCKVDHEKQVNVFLMRTFSPKNNETYLGTMHECFSDFSKNEYPLIVIESENYGGYLKNTNYFQKYVQRMMNIQNLASLRFTNDIEQMYKEDFSKYSVLDSCQPFNSSKELFDKIFIDKYGPRTQVFEMFGKEKKKEMKEIMSTLPKRKSALKPTEIVVFTDGISFSATSLFVKALKYFGGAIIVGYHGNPKSSPGNFDIGQGSSMVLTGKEVEAINPNSYKILEDHGVKFSLFTIAQFYRNPLNPLPEEYVFYPVDERSDIFRAYSEDDSDYSSFVDYAKKVFEKYKVECNPKNEDLVLMSETCEKEYPYGQGGFKCGKDGKWGKSCKFFYCEEGYILNRTTSECIRDPCGSE